MSVVHSNIQAGLQEIFSSIQGEGPWIGVRQVFIRFNACHLKCQYCDTPQRPAAEKCMVETISGQGELVYLDNPLSVETVLNWTQRLLNQAPHHSISLTGGEPLLYTDFLKQLLPRLATKVSIYLETSGTQPEKLQDILDWVEYIAMDIKIPSATGEPMQVEAHRAFYQLSRSKQMFIKLVVSEGTTPDELDPISEIVTDKAMPIVLQPVTDLKTGNNTVSPQKLFALWNALSKQFHDVRIIPQTHKQLGLL